jgi:hypothetical protein
MATFAKSSSQRFVSSTFNIFEGLLTFYSSVLVLPRPILTNAVNVNVLPLFHHLLVLQKNDKDNVRRRLRRNARKKRRSRIAGNIGVGTRVMRNASEIEIRSENEIMGNARGRKYPTDEAEHRVKLEAKLAVSLVDSKLDRQVDHGTHQSPQMNG